MKVKCILFFHVFRLSLIIFEAPTHEVQIYYIRIEEWQNFSVAYGAIKKNKRMMERCMKVFRFSNLVVHGEQVLRLCKWFYSNHIYIFLFLLLFLLLLWLPREYGSLLVQSGTKIVLEYAFETANAAHISEETPSVVWIVL